MIKHLKEHLEAFKTVIDFNKLMPASRKIVFYAEDIQTQNFFIDLIIELLEKFDQEICYLTSDIDDSIFNEMENYPKLKVFYIGSGFFRTWIFMNLKADLFIMTMPDIEKFHLKKSKIYPVHYLYIFHALVSTHSNYRQGAFDSYDTIFCTGKQQIIEIRETEKYYKLPKKNLFRDGYRPLEYLINESLTFSKKSSDKFKILIAPSWGENNILEHCIDELLENIIDSGNEVFLRPHPMTLRNNKNQIEKLKLKFLNRRNFNLQENHTDRNILFESDILITDWSGIGIEYGLGLLKPILYINVPKKNFNPEHTNIDIIPIEVSVRSEIGKIVEIKDIPYINRTIAETIEQYKNDDITKIRDKYVYIKENALNKSAKRILSIANANRSRNINLKR